MINGHGDDSHNYLGGIEHNFSSNVNPWGTAPALIAHLSEQLKGIGAYPNPMATELAQSIEQSSNLCANTVLVTNGAVEAFYLLASLFNGKRSLIFTPTFSEYEDACQKNHHKIAFAKHEEFVNTDFSNADLVWLCNPNNPDGNIIDAVTLTQTLANNNHTIFIIDEAYTHFASEHESIISKLDEFENLIIVRSMTKRYAIPGLRLGYIAANARRLVLLTENLMPWRINYLSIQAGLFSLSGAYTDEFCSNTLLNYSLKLQADINDIPGFEVVLSKTNYFLVKCPLPAEHIKYILASNFKILIRDASNFRGLSNNYIRVAAQLPEANKILVNVLKTLA